jgi:hypothetical protein
MPTAYNSPTPTLDRPLQPGDFARYAETQTTQEQYPAAMIDAQDYSAQPAMHVEAAHLEATSLAQPASAHRGDTIQPSEEVLNHQVATESAALIGGMENMLQQEGDHTGALQTNNYLDRMAEGDYTAPSPEYASGAQLIEAYNAACAIMDVRRATATAAGIEHNYN